MIADQIHPKFFPQPQQYGCGYYAVANVLGNESLLQPDLIEKAKSGMSMHEITKLVEPVYNAHLYPVFSALDLSEHAATRLNLPTYFQGVKPGFTPDTLKASRAVGNEPCMPFLLEVYVVSGAERRHVIGVRLFEDGSVQVFDSLRKKVVCLKDLYALNKSYFRIVSLWQFYDSTNNQQSLVLECPKKGADINVN